MDLGKTLTFTWVYVQDLNGKRYVAKVNPENISKGTKSWELNKGCPSCHWYYVNEYGIIRNPYGDSDVDLLDLSTIRKPKWEDEHPVVIIQTIRGSQNYYIDG